MLSFNSMVYSFLLNLTWHFVAVQWIMWGSEATPGIGGWFKSGYKELLVTLLKYNLSLVTSYGRATGFSLIFGIVSSSSSYFLSNKWCRTWWRKGLAGLGRTGLAGCEEGMFFERGSVSKDRQWSRFPLACVKCHNTVRATPPKGKDFHSKLFI